MTETNISEKADKGAESPTTARPLDFDEDQQEVGVIQPDGSSTTNPRRSSRNVQFAEEEIPPPKPPRPRSPNEQAENTLIEAFPSIDSKVIKAVLVASSGQVEPAFNALLSMSDPSYAGEAAPPQPPRPTGQQQQLEQDELYARQLAEHYNYSSRGYAPHGRGQAQPPQQRGYVTEEEREHSFFDDDLPEIRENLRQGFIQTQSKVNKWISDFRKRIDGEDEDDMPVAGRGTAGRQNFGSSQSDQLYGIQREADAARARRSTDRDRYDADPQVLSDNFTELELRDDEDVPPPKPARPTANPNLFKPTPPPPQSGPVDEVDALYQKPAPGATVNRQPSPAGGKSKKWQPLTSVAPGPMDSEDNDPFALGDSEDDKDKERKKSVDIRAEDTARLKRMASEASAGDTGSEEKKTLQETQLSGSSGVRNKEAEELLSGEQKK